MKKIMIKNLYLSKDPKTKKEGYYRDYFYPLKCLNYLKLGYIVLWICILIYILITHQKFTFDYTRLISAHIIFFVLSIIFSLDTERASSNPI